MAVATELFHLHEVSQDGGATPGLQEGQVLVYIRSTYWRLAKMEVQPHDFKKGRCWYTTVPLT